MKEIGKDIYLEDSFAGVVLGAVKLDHRFLFLDSPIRLPDQQLWREKVAQLGKTVDRITLLMDAHIDRTIGLHALGGNFLGHENTVEFLSNRPSVLRAQDFEPGSASEALNPPGNVRWVYPNMTFTHKMILYASETPIKITHRWGAHPAGCWVWLDAEKIIFVGDSVVEHQPPFLAWANLETWQDELAELQEGSLQDYKIISSRNGLVRRRAIDKMADFLLEIQSLKNELDVLDDRKEAIADMLPGLLRKLNVNKKHAEQYRQRLAYGLNEYLKRHETREKEEKQEHH